MSSGVTKYAADLAEMYELGADELLEFGSSERFFVLAADYAAIEAECERTESRLHEVSSLCATVEQERDTLRQQLAERDADIIELARGANAIQDALEQQRDKLAGLLIGLKVSVRDRAAGRAILADDVYELIDAALSELTP